ncbi:MAG: hypothetical protein ACR2ND_10475 [Solirubrobacteraceae bacterium]
MLDEDELFGETPPGCEPESDIPSTLQGRRGQAERGFSPPVDVGEPAGSGQWPNRRSVRVAGAMLALVACAAIAARLLLAPVVSPRTPAVPHTSVAPSLAVHAKALPAATVGPGMDSARRRDHHAARRGDAQRRRTPRRAGGPASPAIARVLDASVPPTAPATRDFGFER